MSRLAVALTLIAGSITAVLHGDDKPPARPLSDASAPEHILVARDRASRDETRPPLRPSKRFRNPAKATPRPVSDHVRRGRPAGVAALNADVTAYCATGSRNAAGRWPQLGDVAVRDRSIPFGTHVLIDGRNFVVEDWIGSGSDFDLYFGAGPDCERRALAFGRRHERVVVER